MEKYNKKYNSTITFRNVHNIQQIKLHISIQQYNINTAIAIKRSAQKLQIASGVIF